MIENPIASVIVLNWNGKRFLQKCIASLLNQSFNRNYEVLLVDNGSTDGSLDLVRLHFDRDGRLKIIPLGNNYGFSKGNNLGMSYSRGKYLVVLNDDTEVEPNFLKELVETAESDENIASVSCKVKYYNGNVWFGQYFTNHGFIVPFLTQNLFKAALAEKYSQFSVNLANSGCAVLYRKEVIEKIGGFDEDFWADWEDYDLGYRINIAGYKSVYIPSYLCLHYGGGSFGFSPNRMGRMYTNMLFTYFKNYERKNFAFRFPIFLWFLLPLYHSGWIVDRLLFSPPDYNKRKGIEYLFSLPKAYLKFASQLKTFCRKRYVIDKLRKIPDSQIFSNTYLKFL